MQKIYNKIMAVLDKEDIGLSIAALRLIELELTRVYVTNWKPQPTQLPTNTENVPAKEAEEQKEVQKEGTE